jgi:hypothetical protein
MARRSPPTRRRSQTRVNLTASDVQEGITGGSSSGLYRESRMGDKVKKAARAIVGAGTTLRYGR